MNVFPTCSEGLRVEKEALLMAPWGFVRSHLIKIQNGGCFSNKYDCSVWVFQHKNIKAILA